jgi:hypothetical protein
MNILFVIFHNIVASQHIARQQLEKNSAIRARNNRTNVFSLWNGKIAITLHVFFVVYATQQ